MILLIYFLNRCFNLKMELHGDAKTAQFQNFEPPVTGYNQTTTYQGAEVNWGKGRCCSCPHALVFGSQV
jgi:hypothetical protein